MDERYPTDGAAIAAREAEVDALRARCEQAEAEARALRALLAEVADWMDGLGIGKADGAFCPCTSDAEIAEELLPRLRAALSETP